MEGQNSLENNKVNISKMMINKRFLISKLIHETAHSNIYLGLLKIN